MFCCCHRMKLLVLVAVLGAVYAAPQSAFPDFGLLTDEEIVFINKVQSSWKVSVYSWSVASHNHMEGVCIIIVSSIPVNPCSLPVYHTFFSLFWGTWLSWKMDTGKHNFHEILFSF